MLWVRPAIVVGDPAVVQTVTAFEIGRIQTGQAVAERIHVLRVLLIHGMAFLTFDCGICVLSSNGVECL